MAQPSLGLASIDHFEIVLVGVSLDTFDTWRYPQAPTLIIGTTIEEETV